MTATVSQAELLNRVAALAQGPARYLVALTGPPGAGKSHLAQVLHRAMPDRSAVLAMDGFHLDDGLLAARGDLARKGAPHSFDLDGFAAMLDRVQADDGRDVLVPVFDRELEISRAAAAQITPAARVILVEGNYLLLNRPGWSDIAARFALKVMVSAPDQILRHRLTARWQHLPPDQAQIKLEGNDFPNMRLVQDHSLPPDLTVINC